MTLTQNRTGVQESFPSGGMVGGQRGTVLVVDDESSVRCSLKIVFQGEYRVIVAESAYQALALVRQFKVHVAILDIRMPGMTGTELLGRLKEVEPAIQVIMLSAYETVEFVRQSLRLGACDYLTKPFDVAALRMTVERAMRRRILADEVRLNELELRRLREGIERERMQAELARQRGEIYACVIHDLNNPLTVIAGVVELINREVDGLTRLGGAGFGPLEEHLEMIRLQVSNCSQISRRYLGFLRQGVTGAHVMANQAMADVQMLLKSNRAAHRNRLLIRPLDQDVQLRMNGTDLIQALLNLVTNAFQSGTPPISVVVSAIWMTGSDGFVPEVLGIHDLVLSNDAWDHQQPCLCISVEDDGPGIPPGILSRVFDPYFTTKQVGEGSGLGLAIVWRLVKCAGGLMHLHSVAGKGTNFSIYLPVSDTPASRHAG